ncbi:MAG TPA: hypothetical protein VFP87_08075 [Chitinophagaceae bacterium]|nr:hypothetical protein [Chitinophagaceae bacterium]
MKTIFYKFTVRVILLVGILVGIIKGQEARQKWVTKKKIKYEAKPGSRRTLSSADALVMLDEIEMSTYHS